MLGHDLRSAWRSLARAKGFVAVAVTSLALAIGLNTTTFAVLDAFMHPYVPYREPTRLVRISVQGDPREERISWAERDAMLHALLPRFSDSVAYSGPRRGMVVAGDLELESFWQDVSPNYFLVTGLTAELGSLFEADDDDRVVVISHSLWMRAFGGTGALETLSVSLNDEPHRVVAVLPADNNSPWGSSIWRLRPTSDFGNAARRSQSIPVLRLREGVALAALQDRLMELARRLESQYGIVRMPFKYGAEDFQPDPYDLSNFHIALGFSAFAILLIACANLANLMNTRGTARRGELALRLAIGARRGTLVRQLTIEAAILAAAGGLLGVLAAVWGIDLVKAAMPQVEFAVFRPPRISWRFFAFGAVASALTIILFGLLPAMRASDVDVTEPLKGGAATITGRVHRYSVLAAIQVALALLLVVSATMMSRAVYQLINKSFGFEHEGLHRAQVSLRPGSYPDSRTVEDGFDHALHVAEAVPGVKTAAWLSYGRTVGGVILSDIGDTLSVASMFGYPVVSPAFFRTLGMPIRSGRDFAPGDREAGGAAIINDVVAELLWHGENPLGRQLKLGHTYSGAGWVRVIGTVASVDIYGGRNTYGVERPTIYVLAGADSLRSRTLVFRTSPGDSLTPALAARAVRSATGSVAMRTTPWLFNYQLEVGAVKFATRVFLVLGFCGLALAAVGLYGVLSYTTNRRSREFGIRIALGARAADILRMVLHDGTVMYLAGTGIGAIAGLTTWWLLDRNMYEVPPADVWSLLIAELVLCGTAFLACLIPARRAMRSDPVEILRAT